LKKTRYAINALGERERLTNEMTWRRTAIENKMSDMREGGKDYFTYRYLAGQGFTPTTVFPLTLPCYPWIVVESAMQKRSLFKETELLL